MIGASRGNRPRQATADRSTISGGYATIPERAEGTSSSGAGNNPAMLYTVPKLPAEHADWRDNPKPCNDLTDFFVPDEAPEGETTSERDERLAEAAYVRARCAKDCPFRALCSREALAVAQDMAEWQGVTARLYGIWGGITFRGTEARTQYMNKLDKLVEQMNTGEITWEQSNSNQTVQSSPSESPLSPTG